MESTAESTPKGLSLTDLMIFRRTWWEPGSNRGAYITCKSKSPGGIVRTVYRHLIWAEVLFCLKQLLEGLEELPYMQSIGNGMIHMY